MTRAMVVLTVGLLWASARGFASSPPLVPCAEAQQVDSPCVGVLVPEREAAEALTCLRADLPACEKAAEVTRAELAAEVEAAKKEAEAQRKRAEKLSTLLDQAVTPAPPRLEWWQSVEFAVTISVVAVGALTAAIVLGVVD